MTEGSETGTYRKPPSTESDDRDTYDIMTSSIQICPHETLSFERVKRIVRLPHFKYNGDEIDAFTDAPGHYHVFAKEEGYQCKPCPEVFESLKAEAFYRYHWSVDSHFDGLILCVDWTMSFDDHMDVAGSFSDFQRFLAPLEIEICQHQRMSDANIAGKLYRLCKLGGPTGDPVEAYEEMQRRMAYKCARCNTSYETYKDGESCHVLVRRCLGKGKSVYERGWLDQCGDGKHTLRSFGVAAMEGLDRSFGIR